MRSLVFVFVLILLMVFISFNVEGAIPPFELPHSCETIIMPPYPEYYEMTESTYLCPGEYTGTVKITCSDCFLDCQGATFVNGKIQISSVDNVEVRNCNMVPGTLGFLSSTNSRIIDNYVNNQGSTYDGIVDSGVWDNPGVNNLIMNNIVIGSNQQCYGILSTDHDLTISNNEVSDFKYGISPRWGAENTLIDGNIVHDNEHNIKPYVGSYKDIVINNIVYNGYTDGIWMTEANDAAGDPGDSVVRDNVVYDSKYCIRASFKEGTNLLIEGNEVSNCKQGVTFIDYITPPPVWWDVIVTAVVRNNEIITNNHGIGVVVSGVQEATFYHNNIFDNAIQVIDDGINTVWDAGSPAFIIGTESGGNYWDDYDSPNEGCDDLNRDGICDLPYPIKNSAGEIVEYDNFPSVREFR